MKSFAFYSLVFSFFVVGMKAAPIAESETSDLGKAFRDMKEGVGDFSTGVKDLWKVSNEKGDPVLGILVDEGGEEMGGAGTDPRLVYAISKTADSASKILQGVTNGLVTSTGMDKLGVPTLQKDSAVLDFFKSNMANMMMGTSMAAAAAANMMQF